MNAAHLGMLTLPPLLMSGALFGTSMLWDASRLPDEIVLPAAPAPVVAGPSITDLTRQVDWSRIEPEPMRSTF